MASILVFEVSVESFIIIDVYKIDIRITGKVENICKKRTESYSKCLKKY
tara:strand:+ start:1841 stop:1987 length:147 start_codon:yes stop_codon:yes gene_type:complete